MKPEPGIEHRLLHETIQQAYGITVERLEYVPIGFVTSSYKVIGWANGLLVPGRFFLKVWDQSRWGRISAGRLDFTLALTDRLGQLGFCVPRAIASQSGACKVTAGDLTLVLYEYLAGHTLTEDDLFTAEMLPELANTVARLHQSTTVIGLPIPDVEHFEPPFLLTLLTELAKLETPGVRPGQNCLRELLLPERANLLANIDRMMSLGTKARARQSTFVLCHTDLHGMNMIYTDDGRLFVLDWEGAMLAPAEHDLFMFCGDLFPHFLNKYRAAIEPVTLHAETFGFYFYRRSLEDLTDFLVTILEENTDDCQDEADLEGVCEILASWPGIEHRIRQVERQLC